MAPSVLPLSSSPPCHPLAAPRWKNPALMGSMINNLQESTSLKQKGKGEKRTKTSITNHWLERLEISYFFYTY